MSVLSTSGTIADLRRLYHHLIHGGSLGMYDVDRIARGVANLERLNDYLLRLAQRTPHQVVKDEINELLKTDTLPVCKTPVLSPLEEDTSEV